MFQFSLFFIVLFCFCFCFCFCFVSVLFLFFVFCFLFLFCFCFFLFYYCFQLSYFFHEKKIYFVFRLGPILYCMCVLPVFIKLTEKSISPKMSVMTLLHSHDVS